MKKLIKTTNISWLYLLIGLMFIFTFAGCANQATPADETPFVEPRETPEPSATQKMEPAQPTPTEDIPEIDVDPNDLDGVSIRFVHPWSGAAGE